LLDCHSTHGGHSQVSFIKEVTDWEGSWLTHYTQLFRDYILFRENTGLNERNIYRINLFILELLNAHSKVSSI
jgi:hypothetical protein